MHKFLALTILLGLGSPAFGIEETNILAAGRWSAPVANQHERATIRGRFLVCETPARGPGRATEVAVFLELEECAEAVGNAVMIRAARDSLKCEVRDSTGKVIPQSPGGFGGGIPSPCNVNLPPYSSFRFRVSVYGGGRLQDGGMAVYLATGDHWDLHPTASTDFFLSGTFTIPAPADRSVTDKSLNTWNGKLVLPPIRLPIKR